MILTSTAGRYSGWGIAAPSFLCIADELWRHVTGLLYHCATSLTQTRWTAACGTGKRAVNWHQMATQVEGAPPEGNSIASPSQSELINNQIFPRPVTKPGSPLQIKCHLGTREGSLTPHFDNLTISSSVKSLIGLRPHYIPPPPTWLLLSPRAVWFIN